MQDVLVWTDSKIELFFLQIQGLWCRLENKKQIKINYGGNNKKKIFINWKTFKKKNSSMEKLIYLQLKNFYGKTLILPTIFLIKIKDIFFLILTKKTQKKSVGSIGLNLSTFCSVAIDKKYYPLGIPLILDKVSDKKLLPVISMDTGGAIIGKNRADLFTGRGIAAEKIAGELKKTAYICISSER